jgi:hypothetical protein
MVKVVYLIKHECECGHIDRIVQIDKCDYEFRCPKCGSTKFVKGVVFPVREENLNFEKVLKRIQSEVCKDAERLAKLEVEATRKALEEVVEILGYNPLNKES